LYNKKGDICMGGSEDYMTCDKCEVYEISLMSFSAGVESGIMSCGKHAFCRDCFPQAFKKIEASYRDVDMIRKHAIRYFSWYNLNENSTDEEIQKAIDDIDMEEAMETVYNCDKFPKELCPICVIEDKKKKKNNQDKELLAYLLGKVGMSKKQALKEMNGK